VHAWSGSVYFVREALRKAGCEIIPVDCLQEKGRYVGKAKEVLYKKLTGKTYLRDRSLTLLDAYAAQVSSRCSAIKPEIIFSPGTIPIAHLKSDVPTVFWTDATFAGITDYYEHFKNLCARTLREGKAMEQRALANCSLAIYTSDWAAKSAIDNYDVDPAKVKVVPYGANIAAGRDEEEVRGMIGARSRDEVNLLFVGVDWERKGGPIALETARVLNARGVKTRLHLVGVQPPVEVPDFVTVHGFVSKKTPEGAALLDRLFSEAHFMIVPSRAECFGLVYAEAGSFGVPALAASTGGVPSVITDGVNGRLFPLEESGEGYADFIEKTIGSGYQALALGAYREFRERLNWEVAGARVAGMMRGLL
jgi:glycosyltransferase involved in cell wall biosynthesis